MSAISEKSRPKSLRRKRSVASSTDLPKLYRQFSKNGIDHQEAIEASMSSTNKLIMNAFRDMNIGTNKAETASTRNHANDFMTKGETSTDAHLSSFLLERSFDERCILTEESISGERPSTQSSETECPILHDENGSLDDSEDQTLLKTPLSAKELKLGRTKVINTSSSSIDSGVYSPRSSKRPSVELLSPVDPQSNHIIYPQRRNRTLSGGNGCRPANKASLSGNPVVSVDDTSTCKGSRRLSVDQDAFSELLKAATKLVLDAHPLSMSDSDKAGLQGNSLFLRNSLQYFKRRKSEWDIAGLKPQPEKVVRKKSAEPVLQRVSSKSREPKSKKVSACIICERNKRANESTTSSILIKTTMVRTMQERRRFSEVLKVYKPGELPFTEFVVPKICELRTPTGVPTKLRDLVDDNMPIFVRLTNWNSLYAHLVSKRLLDAHMREFMLSPSNSNQEKGNKFYGEYMPSHGTCGYQRLLQCYQEEPEHCGHETLATLLENGTKNLVT